jgi:hypothetical protein
LNFFLFYFSVLHFLAFSGIFWLGNWVSLGTDAKDGVQAPRLMTSDTLHREEIREKIHHEKKIKRKKKQGSDKLGLTL